MSRQVLNPPRKQNALSYMGKLSSPWAKWFDSLEQTHTQFFPITQLSDGATNVTTSVPLPLMPSYSAAEIALLQNVPNGTIIYNTDTNKLNFRENGAWVTI